MSKQDQTVTASGNAPGEADIQTKLDQAEQLLALERSRTRRFHELLDRIENRCRYSVQIRADDDNRVTDIQWIREQINEAVFLIGGKR